MMLTARARQKRAVLARLAVLATFAVLIFTPKMDVGGQGAADRAAQSPGPVPSIAFADFGVGK